VAESGVAAHWLYKVNNPQDNAHDRLGTQWLQSLLDIQDETRDAAEFWDHVKVDLFPDAVYVFTPKSQIMAMPRGATVVDFAYAIHTNVGDRTVAARINGEQVPLRTELKNGDVVDVVTASVSAPNPAWLSFVRTGRARSKIRHHLKSMEHTESEALGQKLLSQALRAEGIEHFPQGPEYSPIWDKLLRFTGSKTRQELLTDIGLGKRISNIVAKRLVLLLADMGQRPDAVLLTQQRFSASDAHGMGTITLDGSENASVKFATCCRPIPGDEVVGYLGRGEGLAVHATHCAIAKKLLHKDRERFMGVEWSDEPTRQFEVDLTVTVNNARATMAKVASVLAAAEADIVHIHSGEDGAQETKDFYFVIAVRDRAHLDTVLAKLRRTSVVIRADRSKNSVTQAITSP
jgi:GTP pyrophosphokinase